MSFKLELTSEEKLYILYITERYVTIQAKNPPKKNTSEWNILKAQVDFVNDFKQSITLDITCSRVFLKILRMQLNVCSAALEKTIERYNNLDGQSPPFEPLVIGRRKEDYLKNATDKKNICNSILTKIQGLVG